MLCSTQHLTDSYGCLEDQFQHKHGRLRHGRRITVQATAAGRRRRGMKREKMQIAGRSAGRHYENHSTVVRNEAKGKCVHSFSTNVTKGTQNAGKW